MSNGGQIASVIAGGLIPQPDRQSIRRYWYGYGIAVSQCHAHGHVRYFHCYGYHQRGRFTAEPVLQIKRNWQRESMPAQDVCSGLRYNEETAAEAHSRRRFLPVAGRRADVPRKLFFRLKDGFPTGKVVFLRALRFDLSGAHPRVWSKAVGDVCFPPLCRGVFIPPPAVSGPASQEWRRFCRNCCAAGRPSWHRLSGRPVLCQHAFGVLWLLRARCRRCWGCSGWCSCARRKVRESGTRCICGRRIPFTGHSLCVLSVLFALMVSVKMRTLPLRERSC